MQTQVWVQRNKNKDPAEEYFEPVSNESGWPEKPKGGLWTSTWDKTTGGGWIQLSIAERSYGWPSFEVWLLTVEPFTRIYTIENYKDLAELNQRYPATTCLCPEHKGQGLDWEAISKDWDGLHLTEEGASKTRLTIPLNLWAWDCESTLWFRWRFSEAEYAGTKRFDLGDMDA